MSTEKEKFDLADWMRKDLWPLDAACRLVCGGNPYKWDDAARAALQDTDPAKQLPWVKLFGDADGARAKKLFQWYEMGESRGVDPTEFLAWAHSKGYDVAHLVPAGVPPTKVKVTLPVAAQQDNTILTWLRNNKHDPLKIPVPPSGKSGVKKLCRDAVSFSSKSVFDTAWERLRDNGKIKDAK